MTSKLDLVRAWTDLPMSELDASADYISDDFQWVDEDGKVLMNKEAWVGMGHMLAAAFTDYQYMRTDIHEEGNSVIMTGHFKGRHTGDLDLSAMGMGVIPASGKQIVWPEEITRITIEGDKIAKLEPHGESGGMEAFFAAIMGDAPPQ